VLNADQPRDDSVRKRGSRRKSSRNRRAEHILIVTYLYAPCDAINVRRPLGLRRAFESAGVRTTVLTSKISGSADDDAARRIFRTGDLRTRFQTQYQALVGYSSEPIETRAIPRWWTNFIVPDVAAVSWFPAALWRLLKLIRNDRPDAIVTTSPLESSHLLGLVARAFGIRWIADFRDGWMYDSPHPRPALRRLDGMLERLVVRRADAVTAVNEQLTSDFRQRRGVPAVHISNGFDRADIEVATDERKVLDSKRFSLVYTGTFGIDLPDRAIRGQRTDVRMFVDALTLLLEKELRFRTSIELVVAGVISDSERAFLTGGVLADVVRVLGRLPHPRALGLQKAADGLLLIPGGAGATTGKIFEYLAAQKPVFAVTQPGSAAAVLLSEAGAHTIAPPDNPQELAHTLLSYFERWSEAKAGYQPRPEFDLDAYEYENLGRKMLDLVASVEIPAKRKARHRRKENRP
jgi:glycosyltransferase involved in cell wall biosynthesis